MQNTRSWILVFGVLAILGWLAWSVIGVVGETTHNALQPMSDITGKLSTQVAEVLHPTPTVLPDPITIVNQVRSLARLETIQYSVEKVITAEVGQGTFGFLFGDRLLFVAHGIVIAGVDLAKLGPEDLWIKNEVLYVHLPPPEVFVATLDNEKSYVYDRDTGVLTHGYVDLETTARKAAEEEIMKAALEDGILEQARQNAENFLYRLLRDLKFPEVIFVETAPEE
ncbi:MAG: DUF4230 domain-containing protein [Chloroflexota bacterium]